MTTLLTQLLSLLVGVVRAADQGAGLDVADAQAAAFLLERGKLVWRIEARHRQLFAGRPQILANRDDVNSYAAQILQHRQHFFKRLTQSHHEA